MSTTPPYTPVGGGAPPNPPYDPKTQWRAYRAQQKAAWRAQRDAWKAQRYTMKANAAGIFGPKVPSLVGPVLLIGIGVVALLVVTGRIAGGDFATWYGHWWPLLLIFAGMYLLAEWAIDMRREVPVRRSGGFIGVLVLLGIIGLCCSGWNKFGPFRTDFGDDGDNFFNAFGLPEHDFDQKVLSTSVPANATIDIQNPRGDVSVTADDVSTVQVEAHEVAFANSDDGAKKIFDAEKPDIKVSGNAVLVKSESNSNGRLNLTVTVPRAAQVTVDAGKGDVVLAGLGAGAIVSAAHGDVHLNSIKGSVQVHLEDGKGDFSAHEIEGDLTVDGTSNDLTLSEIKGKITQNGEIRGEVHIEHTTGAVHMHTTVTDLEVAELPGDLTLNDDDLRVTEAKGPVRVQTHSKDIDLSQIYGDSHVETRDGSISVAPAGNYAVEAKNDKGDVEVTLPPNASASVNVRTRNGDIVSDYAMPSIEGEIKAATFQIGSGGPALTLSAENGDVRIKRGSGFAEPPPASPVPPAPSLTGTPHLKAPKAPAAPPVAQ